MNASLIDKGASFHKFTYENIAFDYHLILERRKTITATVFPTKALLVKAPSGTPHQRIDKFLQKKFRWVLKQQRYFAQFRTFVEKRYVSGETFRYRGRSYKLLVRRDASEQVSLTHGTLMVFSSRPSEPEHTKVLLDGWFSRRARIVFNDRLRECYGLFDYSEMPGLMVRRMRRRWGSYSHKTGRVILNTNLIGASTRHIDYVIIHELCHITQRKHNREFYELLESKLPHWRALKTELELSLLS